MKDLLTDANFPRTLDHRVYHLGVRHGEVANRIVAVGPTARAYTFASYLDPEPKPFVLTSERGYLTITGCYKYTPITIVSIGIGSPNMDLFVREFRESVAGDMLISDGKTETRLGSCGAIVDVQPGTVVVPNASVEISRNFDFDFINPENCSEPPYRISKPVSSDEELTQEVARALETAQPPSSKFRIIEGKVNASADSFYSSQGRQTSFPDHNADLIEHLQQKVDNIATLEMETFHLFHLAACWGKRTPVVSSVKSTPLTAGRSHPVIVQSSNPTPVTQDTLSSPKTTIRAAAAHMVFASRTSQDFITPQQVEEVEQWAAKGILNALVNVIIPRLHPTAGSVWGLE